MQLNTIRFQIQNLFNERGMFIIQNEFIALLRFKYIVAYFKTPLHLKTVFPLLKKYFCGS